MSGRYSYVRNVSELSGWIRDEVEYKKEFKLSRRKGGLGVKRIQEWLVYHGYALNPDAHFGPVTQANVKMFQLDNGIRRTGTVNKATFEALVAPMRKILKRPPVGNMNYNEAVLMHANRHLQAHPIEIGHKGNSGMWVRLYMKGHEGEIQRWCAGFVSFITQIAAETLEIDPPISRNVSCDLMAADAQRKGLFENGRDTEISDIAPGSIFLIRATENDWVHTGIVSSVDRRSGKYTTIEGNADHEGSANGFEVCSISRGAENTDFIIFEPSTPIVFNAPDIEVRRYFYEGPQSYTYGSFYKYWDGWITAAHVIEQMDGKAPPFASGSIAIRPNEIDGALIGCNLPTSAPRQLYIGQKITVRGFPGGSGHPSDRVGEVYYERNSDNLMAGAVASGKAWIVKIDNPEEPVVTGMSGGLAMDDETGMPVGILITSNSRAQLDPDPQEDHSMDIVSLRDIYDAMTAAA